MSGGRARPGAVIRNGIAKQWRRPRWHQDARYNSGGGSLGGGPRPAVTTTGARGAERAGLRIGDDVTHEKFGEGVVLELFGDGDKTEALVNFRGAGEKRLLLAWAPLHKIEH